MLHSNIFDLCFSCTLRSSCVCAHFSGLECVACNCAPVVKNDDESTLAQQHLQIIQYLMNLVCASDLINEMPLKFCLSVPIAPLCSNRCSCF